MMMIRTHGFNNKSTELAEKRLEQEKRYPGNLKDEENLRIPLHLSFSVHGKISRLVSMMADFYF